MRSGKLKVTKYLGMIEDDILTWEDHIDYITLKIYGGIGIIRRVRQLIPEKALLLLYMRRKLKDKLQALQNRAARSIAKVK